jgi:hypothetical protein
MKKVLQTSIILIIAILASCTTTTKFPVSTVTPGADILMDVKKVGTNNYKVSITSFNLASTERLDPPQAAYVIWMVSNTDVLRNVGNFSKSGDNKLTFTAFFPYMISEVFITAEGSAGACKPEGIEITRIKF